MQVKIYIYIHYIHPELRIEDRRSESEKRAWPLWREQRGSTGENTREHEGEHEGAEGSTKGASEEHVGAAQGSLNRLPRTRQ